MPREPPHAGESLPPRRGRGDREVVSQGEIRLTARLVVAVPADLEDELVALVAALTGEHVKTLERRGLERNSVALGETHEGGFAPGLDVSAGSRGAGDFGGLDLRGVDVKTIEPASSPRQTAGIAKSHSGGWGPARWVMPVCRSWPG